MTNMIIGTAGHIDHGKTSLVKALTGVDTDRLKEEKERGITIELGFARLVLPSGQQVAFIDVPGHERFIKNMLAGVVGIDLALLVVSADEGVMPQTREHLDILRLLEVKKLIVVLTKIDLVEPDFVDLVMKDIEVLLEKTAFSRAAIVRFSALNGQGQQELITLLEQAVIEAQDTQRRRTFARLPIDRVFSIKGFGTVVTGTLFSGEINVGDSLEVALKDTLVRVRNIEVHHANCPKAGAGERVAVNLGGVDLQNLERGDVLATPGWLAPTWRVDAACTLLEGSPQTLKAMTRIRFHHGTKEVLARVYPVDREEVHEGETAFLQFLLEEPLCLIREDRFIIRSYSPLITIGGGCILEPWAKKHSKKERQQALANLEIKASGQDKAIMKCFIDERKDFARLQDIIHYMNREIESVQGLLSKLVGEHKITRLTLGEDVVYTSRQMMEDWERKIKLEISTNRDTNPLEPGINKEVIRSKYWPELTNKEFNSLLNYWAQKGVFVIAENKYIAPQGDRHTVDENMQKNIEQIARVYMTCQWQIPQWQEVLQQVRQDEKKGAQILSYLLRAQNVISIGHDLYVWHSLFEDLKKRLSQYFTQEDELNVGQLRDLLQTSRKIALPLLEYLDTSKYTLRKGDKRSKGVKLITYETQATTLKKSHEAPQDL